MSSAFAVPLSVQIVLELMVEWRISHFRRINFEQAFRESPLPQTARIALFVCSRVSNNDIGACWYILLLCAIAVGRVDASPGVLN